MKCLNCFIVAGLISALVLVACEFDASDIQVSGQSAIAFDGSLHDDEVPPCSRFRKS